ncbi:hypothetical protein HPB47_022574 [Ixodes persulcatus]|uniref:Uncharacterized protein n=1 Tax=Ixodes persulcatus TaxID=34615 RepID=A0AC60Q9D7_IXOPE|nr:hypothetical protein HPB47_022574 [Ixodes persulcatus]
MSARDQMRQKLDELMGTGRDGTKNPIHYSDPKVCRCFLLGLCPHDALAGTKMSLGACLKIHNYALKADFENSSTTYRSSQHRFYQLTVLTYLQKWRTLVHRAKKGRLTRCQSSSWNGGAAEKAKELKTYGETVDKKLVQAEELGSQGKVDEALALIREVEKLKRKRNRIEKYLFRKSSEPAKEQKQIICDECLLCIGLDDNEQRVANHSSGRLHNALLEMRRKIAGLAASLEKAQLPFEPRLGLNESSELLSKTPLSDKIETQFPKLVVEFLVVKVSVLVVSVNSKLQEVVEVLVEV